MKADEMWKLYARGEGLAPEVKYDAWRYGGGAPDELVRLTLSGRKTATASAYPIYRYEGCDIPKAGCYSVILDSRGEARCVIKTVSVTLTPFGMVSSDHARKEGEGDLSLDYWRDVHKKVFSMELDEIGESFDDEMTVVCEEFEVVYK